MDKNILGFCIALLACLLVPLHAQQTSAATAKNASKHGRMEFYSYEEKGSPRKGIKFFGPEGKEKKRILERGGVKKVGEKWVSESVMVGDVVEGGEFALVETRKSEYDFDPSHERDSAAPGEYWDETLEVLSAEGNVLAKKTFRTYPGVDLLTTSYWEAKPSRDGKRFFVYYRDEAGRGNVEVYSAAGEKLAHGQAPGEIEKIDSSIDGGLVAGYVFLRDSVTEKVIKHIFILNSFEARTKMIKAEESTIPGWRARFLLSSLVSPKPEPGKIMLIVAETVAGSTDKPRKWYGKLAFEEVPEDLSSLLKISIQK